MPSPPLERARPTSAREYQSLVRNRLIESRLTPNAISLTGLVLCLVAAGLIFADHYFLGGLASLMVSYTRARAEALGVECKVGIADRAVRVVILSAGLVMAKGASIVDVELLEPAVWVLAALSVITVGQRIFHVRNELMRAAAM